MSKTEKKQEDKKLTIKEQIEYYLSDENLKQDSFFHQKISEEPNGYLDIDLLLKCNKIKKAGWSKEEIIEGIKISDIIELDKTNNKVRRKDNKPLPELSLLSKKGQNLKKKKKKKENQ